ncbi:hypothetical protein ACFL39_01370 [Gemmatimonadota bacterium]
MSDAFPRRLWLESKSLEEWVHLYDKVIRGNMVDELIGSIGGNI